MGRLVIKIIAVLLVLTVLGLVLPLLYIANNFSIIDETPKAPVVGVPFFDPPELPRQHYQGRHPRLSNRPAETFVFPIAPGEVGPIEPLFAGPNRHPFYCGSNRHTGHQPLVDNQEGFGVPVFSLEDGEQTDDIVGYSLHCSHPTTADYWYNRAGTEDFYPLEAADNDVAKITVNGREMDFVVRVESGTINRFHYIMAALRGDNGDNEMSATPNGSNWNRRLIYQFRGGVGIGKQQGNISLRDVLRRRFEQVKAGYGVVYSTANQTANHYNMWLAEDTALRVKRQFVSQYGEPLYTVGIGGSGGAIQQYLFAQNHPGLLDAIIPLYSYPDMVTQTIHVFDCEPLEYYFDVTAGRDSRWRNWEARRLIEGMNARNDVDNQFTLLVGIAQLLHGKVPSFDRGATECTSAWRGLTPLVHNPNFDSDINYFDPAIARQVHWSHWEDLQGYYGVNEYGYANNTWDNVGVQYGLQALLEKKITVEEFLHLNSNVGAWKPPRLMGEEKFWLLVGDLLPVNLSIWSHHNMYQREEGQAAAQRAVGSREAIEGAYRSGQVFIGYADLPIIDLRHYLDPDLDMHHATASFSARQRLLDGQGFADNQLIWMSDPAYDPTVQAFAVIDLWMENIRNFPERGVAANKPAAAQDQCFDAEGNVIALGSTVWDGSWNNQAQGECMHRYPRYQTSREVAGDSVAGGIFKCFLQPVATAIERDLYGEVDMRPHQQQLEQIFPDGVCDYSRGDTERPVGLLE
jgi:hypothetical protein